jgi:hypothetical protein
MKNIIFAVILIFCFLGVANAELVSTSCYQPKCPDCIVTCQKCPDIADVSVNCGNTTLLPGLWKVALAGGMKCGEVTVVGGSSAYIEDQYKQKTFFLLNKVKIFTQVETCE